MYTRWSSLISLNWVLWNFEARGPRGGGGGLLIKAAVDAAAWHDGRSQAPFPRAAFPQPPGNLEEPLLLPWHPTRRGRVPQKAGRSELPSLPAFGPAAHARIQPRSWLAGAKSRASHTHDKCSLVSFLTHRRVWREKTSKHGHRLPWHSGRAILSSPHFPPLQASCCNYQDACPPAGALENWLARQSLISPRLPSWHGSSLRRESRLRALPTSSSRVATGGGTPRGTRLGATRRPKDISEAWCASSGEDAGMAEHLRQNENNFFRESFFGAPVW